VTAVLASTVNEVKERKLMQRQAVIVVPMKKDGQLYTAGLNGNKGAVFAMGEEIKKIKKLAVVADKIGMNGDKAVSQVEEHEKGYETLYPDVYSIQTMATISDSDKKEEKKKDKKVKESDLAELHSSGIDANIDGDEILDLYEKDVEAAEEEIGGMKDFLDKSRQEALGVSYDHLEKQRDQAEGIFANLFNAIFGKDGDGDDCGGGVGLDGKAVNLSSHFKVLGPKIAAECKKQGLEKYKEI